MKKFIFLVFPILASCSFAGPYVTNISPAGESGVLVEKCTVQLNSLTGNVSTGDCNTSYIWLGGKAGLAGNGKDGTPNNVISIK